MTLSIPSIWVPDRTLLGLFCPTCGKPRRQDMLGKARRFRDWMRAPIHAMGRGFSANGWVFGASGGCVQAATGSGCGCSTNVQQLRLCGFGLSSVYIPVSSLPVPFSSNYYLLRSSDGLCYYAAPGDAQVAYTTQTLVGTFTAKTACGCEKCPSKVSLSFSGLTLATTCTSIVCPGCVTGYVATPHGTPSFGTYANIVLGSNATCSTSICGTTVTTTNGYFDTGCTYSGFAQNANIYISYYEDATLGPMWGVAASAAPLNGSGTGDAWIFWGCAPSQGNSTSVTINNKITSALGSCYNTRAINNLENACCPPATLDNTCISGVVNIVMGTGGSCVLTPTP